MVASLLEAYQLSTNLNFRAKVRSAIANAAVAVHGELTSGITERDQKRRDLAFGVLNNPDAYVERFATLVAVNPIVLLTSNDVDIQATVNGLWNDVAGYAG